MQIDSYSTKSFYADQISKQKKFVLTAFAYYMRYLRNQVSEYFFKHFIECSIIKTKEDFITYMRHLNMFQIDSSFDHVIYEQIFVNYSNRAKQIRNILKFDSISLIGFQYYKRKTKKHKAGDFKCVNNKTKTTPLSMTLTYLARYGFNNFYIVDDIETKINKITYLISIVTDTKKLKELNDLLKYYTIIFNCIQRHLESNTYDRLLVLALDKRQRILNKYETKLIEYESLTFSGVSRKKFFIDRNTNTKSRVKYFINLSQIDIRKIPVDILPEHMHDDFNKLLSEIDKQLENILTRNKNTGKFRMSSDYIYDNFYIPVYFDDNTYFGNLDEYIKKRKWYEYTVVFDKFGRIKINFAKPCNRYIPEVTSEDEIFGIDVNIKHNMMMLSDGTVYDYDRDLLKQLTDLLLHIDNLKKEHKKYNSRRVERGQEEKPFFLGKKLTKKKKAIEENIIHQEERTISDMLKYLVDNNIKHIAMENLNNGFGRTKVKTEDDLNYNRLVSAVNLSSIKNRVKSIAVNYDIAVSFVNPAYTSKMCPVCGCIHDRNRQEQEIFKCVQCGHTENADLNAAINIKNRLSDTVFRDKLFETSKYNDGTYLPKKLKKEQVKEILLENFCSSESLSTK